MAFPDATRSALRDRADLVLSHGMGEIASKVAAAGVSDTTNQSHPLAKSFVLGSLMGAQPTGYALACRALAIAEDPDYAAIRAPVLIVAGPEDKTSSTARTEQLARAIQDAKRVELPATGHWMMIEDVRGAADALKSALLSQNGHI